MNIYVDYLQDIVPYAQFTNGKDYSTPFQIHWDNWRTAQYNPEGYDRFKVCPEQEILEIEVSNSVTEQGSDIDYVSWVKNARSEFVPPVGLLTNYPAIYIEFETRTWERVRFRDGVNNTPFQPILALPTNRHEPGLDAGSFTVGTHYVGRVVSWVMNSNEGYFVTGIVDYQNRPSHPASIMNTWSENLISLPS